MAAGCRNTEVSPQASPSFPGVDATRLRLAATVDQVTVRAMITPAQSRATRGRTNWSLPQIASAFEVAGVEFIPEDSGAPGVKLKKLGPT